jgi:hypothetical protein
MLVFLRILEYYSGILFLTTNRVGSFDDGFRSRIHLTLYYPDLTARQTTKIWKTNIRRIEQLSDERTRTGRPGIGIERKKILKWSKKERKQKGKKGMRWNGRQIRNSFQTALALAEFEAQSSGKEVEITQKHFEKIADAINEFDRYLLHTHGDSEEKWARRRGERAESFDRKKSEREQASELTDSSESSSSDEEERDKPDSEDDKRKKKKKSAEKKSKEKKRKQKDSESSSE